MTASQPDALPPRPGGRRADRAPRTQWYLLGALLLLGTVAVLQDTKYAVIMAKHTVALWMSVGCAIVAYLVLRAHHAGEAERMQRQQALGTIADTYYPPRRQALIEGGTVLGGVLGALWWGAMSWIVLVGAIRIHMPSRGLFDLEMSVVVGAVAYGVVGAMAGYVTGAVWERWHRRRRLRRGGP